MPKACRPARKNAHKRLNKRTNRPCVWDTAGRKLRLKIKTGREDKDMKYIVMLGDGMADYPVEALGGKTPLEVAKKPNIDRLARGAVSYTHLTLPTKA